MTSCQCQGIEDQFNSREAAKKLADYHKNGPTGTTRLLITALKEAGGAAPGIAGPHSISAWRFRGAGGWPALRRNCYTRPEPVLLPGHAGAGGPVGRPGQAALRLGLSARYLVDAIGIGYRERAAAASR